MRTTAGETRSDPTKSAAIDGVVQNQIDDAGPGLALAVTQFGVAFHLAGYGLANIAAKTPVTPRTLFHIASCGKQFTGLGIVMLAAARKLRYDDHISRYIPELAAFPAGVTIRNLLHHVSGVQDFYEIEDATGELLSYATRPVNEDVIKLYAANGCPMNDPVTHAYSNAGYDLLGSVIERVSGQRYGDFFATRVFGPIGMTDTLPPPAARGPRVATGYAREGSRLAAQTGSPLDSICGSGSFYSTASDLCRYEMALTGHQLVSAQDMREALSNGVPISGTRQSYGFGWFLDNDYVEHDGSWTGFFSHIRRYSDGMSVYALSNNPDISPNELVTQVAKAVR